MVLESREHLIIKSIDRAEFTVYQKILIADEAGKDLARLSLDVSDYVDLKAASVRLFNQYGKQRGRFKKKDFSAYKGSNYGIIGSDNSELRLNLEASLPIPFTMEVEYTFVIRSLFFWPDWIPQKTIPVISASYELEIPQGYGFSSFSPSGMKPEHAADNHFIWKLTDLAPMPDEISMPSEVYDQYRLFFSADSFTLDEYSGSLTSWLSFAAFYQLLAREQYTLDLNLIQDLEISSASTVRDTIAQIYDYVQRSTRYVGMELGVHGWKPHSSEWVCKNRYGDCKDLATHFISLLKYYEIKAYPVLILTRNRGVTYPQFPNSRFNHMITCVPIQGDTLWVDCTVDNSGIDVIPEYDQGCTVLVVGGEGPVLTQTPMKLPAENAVHFQAELGLHDDGSASIEGEWTFTNQAGMSTRGSFLSATEKERRESIIRSFRESAPGLVLETYSITGLDDNYTPITIAFKASIPHLATRTGKRLFVNLALPVRAAWYGEHPSRRTVPFFAGTPSHFSSEIDLRFSGELSLESLPTDVEIDSEFGRIHQTIRAENNAIHYSWLKIDRQMCIAIEDYEGYYNFRLSAKQAQDSRLVFTHK